MKNMNYRTLIKMVNKMRPSEIMFVDDLNLSANSVEVMKKMIENNVLIFDGDYVAYRKGGKDFQEYMM